MFIRMFAKEQFIIAGKPDQEPLTELAEAEQYKAEAAAFLTVLSTFRVGTMKEINKVLGELVELASKFDEDITADERVEYAKRLTDILNECQEAAKPYTEG